MSIESLDYYRRTLARAYQDEEGDSASQWGIRQALYLSFECFDEDPPEDLDAWIEDVT